MANGSKYYFGNWRVYSATGYRYIGWTGAVQTVMYDGYSNVTFAPTGGNERELEWIEFTHNNKTYLICNNFVWTHISYNQAIKLCQNAGTVTHNGKTYRFTLLPVTYWDVITTAFNHMGVPFKCIPNTYMLTSELSGGQALCVQAVGTTGGTGAILNALTKKTFAMNGIHSHLAFIPALVMDSSSPIISGSDEHLGDKTEAFTVSYSVSDPDSSKLYVKESLNGVEIRRITNPVQNSTLVCSITQDLLASVAVGSTATIEIEVGDGSSTVYRRYTFTKVNSIPVITILGSTDLGSISEIPTILYTVEDSQSQELTVVEKLNGKAVRTYKVPGREGKTQTVSISEYNWLLCKTSTNTVQIIVTDSLGGQASKSVEFKRKIGKVQIMTANPIETDIAASKILLSPQWTTKNCTCTAEACNNGFDDNPTWEDITEMVKQNKPYSFTNKSKTASKWGIKIRLTVVKNQGYTGEAAIYGFGGAYE